MIYLLAVILSIVFFYITYRSFSNGLFLFFMLLPVYLIRFDIGTLPTTLLEIMFWIILFNFILITAREKKIKAWFLQTKEIIKKNNTLFIGILLFLIGATASIFWSINIRAALGEWKAFYFEPVILFLILLTGLKNKKQWEKTLIGMLLGGVVTGILAVYQHFTGWLVPYSFWQNRNTYRVTAWYGFPNAVGLFIAPLVPILLYFIYKKLKEKQKIKTFLISQFPSLIIIIFFLLAIIFAKSTGGLVGVAGGIGLLLFLYKKTRYYILALGILSILILLFISSSNPVKQELLMQDRSGKLRTDMWAETFVYLTSHPIKGIGMASYSKVIHPYRIDKHIEVFHHPHNLFLTIWANTGMIGLIGFITIIVATVSKQIKIYKQKKHFPMLNAFVFSCFFVFLIMGLVDSPYIKNDLAMFFWLVVALLFKETYNGQKNHQI